MAGFFGVIFDTGRSREDKKVSESKLYLRDVGCMNPGTG